MGCINKRWDTGSSGCTFAVATIRILHETSTAKHYLTLASDYRLWRDCAAGCSDCPPNSHPNPDTDPQFDPRHRRDTYGYAALSRFRPIADALIRPNYYAASCVDHCDPSA